MPPETSIILIHVTISNEARPEHGAARRVLCRGSAEERCATRVGRVLLYTKSTGQSSSDRVLGSSGELRNLARANGVGKFHLARYLT